MIARMMDFLASRGLLKKINRTADWFPPKFRGVRFSAAFFTTSPVWVELT
jgi:hypothetical protein